jgi:hypothetical protein
MFSKMYHIIIASFLCQLPLELFKTMMGHLFISIHSLIISYLLSDVRAPGCGDIVETKQTWCPLSVTCVSTVCEWDLDGGWNSDKCLDKSKNKS